MNIKCILVIITLGVGMATKAQEQALEISGIVKDENNVPINAEIILKDKKNNNIIKTISNHLNGEYNIKISSQKNNNYYVVFLKENYFFKVEEIKYSELQKKGYKIKKEVVLQKLKEGGKYIIGGKNNFYGNSTNNKESAHISMEALHELMSKNQIKIEIWAYEPYDEYHYNIETSSRIAKNITHYLIKNGIGRERIKDIDYLGAQKYKVEIKIITY
ncbi:MAG: hypothetical protein WC264_02455 [Candidatus Paceibacterota bacterium]|jgi:hypothetical protein